jgi:DNA-binding GntR family transcriptional regulator
MNVERAARGGRAVRMPPRDRRDVTVVSSLRAEAYREIKRRITTTAYRPGEILNETLVAESLRIGRTPVHEALNRLALEGMIEVIPRKGIIVKPVSLNEMREVAQVRVSNEVLCVSLAARHADDADIRAMRAVLDATPAAIAKRDVEAMMNLDRDFHCAISRAARNRTLADVLLQLHERSLRFWFISLSAPHHMEQVQREHRAIFNAIRAHDPRAAARAVTAHIHAYVGNITQQL